MMASNYDATLSLLNEGANIHDAAEYGRTAVVQLLLEAGAAVDAVDEEDNTALHLAAWNGHTPVVQLLLDAQASVNAAGNERATALHYAAYDGHIEVVQLLLEAGAAVNAADFVVRHLFTVQQGRITRQSHRCCWMQVGQ
jgi:ankyrin repeat protein